MMKSDKMWNAQNIKMWKRDHFLPLRIGGVDFGLKTRSRGTPWNSKNAGPGGSEFTKCRFWPFKWHFALFRGGSIFDHFFVIFWWFQFYHFFGFCVFEFCHFFCFSDFWVFVTFWVFVDFDENTFFYSFSSFFKFENSRVKIRPSFDLFCPPSSTPMASTWWCSILNVKF